MAGGGGRMMMSGRFAGLGVLFGLFRGGEGFTPPRGFFVSAGRL